MNKRVISLCLILVLMLGGCGQTEKNVTDDTIETEDKIQIGMSFDSFVIERWQRDRDVFVSTAREKGAEVNVQNANGDIEEQKAQIEYFIQKKMDVIVVICIDANGLQDVIGKAKSAGIKVISYDRLIADSDVDLYISFDNEKVGMMMGQALIREGLPNNSVLMLCGPTTDHNVALVEKGFRSIMDQNSVNIVDVMYAEGWRAELASDYIYNHTDILGKVDGIMCGNDSLATQTIRALAEKRQAGKIKVVGQDADLEGCQRIVEGTQVMTVYKPVEKLAQTAAEYAIKMAKGEDLGTEETVSDGTYDVPAVVLEPVAVNKDNMDEVIIDSGYHLREDVYLNVPAG